MSNLTDRQIKALTMIINGGLEHLTRTTDGYVLVPSQTHVGAFYKARPDECSCPDAQYRVRYCKHQIALQLAVTLKNSALDAPQPLAEGTYVAPNGSTIPASMRAQRED